MSPLELSTVFATTPPPEGLQMSGAAPVGAASPEPAPAEGSCLGQDVTHHLRQLAEGRDGAFDVLVGLVYPQMEGIARGQLRKLRFGQTLDTRGLVHEAYLKMLHQEPVDWQDRQHFFAVTSRAMRQILVDHARRRSAQKRGGGEEAVELHEELLVSHDDSDHVLQLDQALGRLGELHQDLRQVVELRFFGGLSEPETAEAMGTSLRTVQRLWQRARIWLRSELGG